MDPLRSVGLIFSCRTVNGPARKPSGEVSGGAVYSGDRCIRDLIIGKRHWGGLGDRGEPVHPMRNGYQNPRVARARAG